MDDENDHQACVDAWMDRTARGLSAEELVDLLGRAFGAMWSRAHVTLGEVTLGAIVARVLYSASEQDPLLESLTVEATGLRCAALRERVAGASSDQIAAGMRFVLVEFLTVLGSLTAEILTPALHAELSKVVTGDGPRATDERESEPQDADRKDREDAES